MRTSLWEETAACAYETRVVCRIRSRRVTGVPMALTLLPGPTRRAPGTGRTSPPPPPPRPCTLVAGRGGARGVVPPGPPGPGTPGGFSYGLSGGGPGPDGDGRGRRDTPRRW